MDLDTFLTELYVLVDDWYKAEGCELLTRHAGPKLQLSDSEVLTLTIAGRWRVGVPWQTERGLVRYMQADGRRWFPRMLKRSAFNERSRKLWRGCLRLQQQVAGWLETATCSYESTDSVPLPAASLAQALREGGHWLWWSSKGHGGNHGGWYWGEQLLLSVSQTSAITGWLVGPATSDDRWLLQALVSERAHRGELVGPLKRPRDGARRPLPPVGEIVPADAVGVATGNPYLADQGFNGDRWQQHWRQYGAIVITIPPPNTAHAWTKSDKRWLRRHRQVIETVYSRLVVVFGLCRLQAHSRAGQLNRLAAIGAAHNIGLWFNQQVGRPAGALETLLC